MQLSAQIVLAAMVAGSALGAPLPEPLRFKLPTKVDGVKGLDSHLPKINGGLALTAGGLGIGAGVATAQNNNDASQPAPAPAPAARANKWLALLDKPKTASAGTQTTPSTASVGTQTEPKPPSLDTSYKDAKNGALNGGIGTAAGLAGIGGASYGLYNALNPADPAPAPAPSSRAEPELEELQRRLNPAMAAGLLLSPPSVDVSNADVTQQVWHKGPKTSGATSRRDIDDDADVLNRRLLSFGSSHQSQTAQGGADGGKASGAASGTRGSLFAGGDNGSGLFGQPMMAPAAAAKRLFEEPAEREVTIEEPSLQRRLMFGIDTQNQDVTQQQWLVGGKTSGATS